MENPPSDRRSLKVKGDEVPFPLDSEDRLSLKLAEKARRNIRHAFHQQKLVTLPGVQSLSIATRYIEGGRERFVEFVQMAVLNRMEVAQQWWAVYADLLPNERRKVSFDDVCAAAGIKPSELMSVVVSTAMEFGQDVGNLVAATMHPKVTAQLAKSAERISGEYADVAHRDRMAFLQSQRFLPTPKGTTVHVNASANAQAAAAAQSEPSVPGFADDMAALAPVRQGIHREILEGAVTPDSEDE